MATEERQKYLEWERSMDYSAWCSRCNIEMEPHVAHYHRKDIKKKFECRQCGAMTQFTIKKAKKEED